MSLDLDDDDETPKRPTGAFKAQLIATRALSDDETVLNIFCTAVRRYFGCTARAHGGTPRRQRARVARGKSEARRGRTRLMVVCYAKAIAIRQRNKWPMRFQLHLYRISDLSVPHV